MSLELTRDRLAERVARWMPAGWNASSLRVHGDTTDFCNIDYGDVVLLGDRPYLVRNSAREGRFGLEDEIKPWVKRSIDLTSGDMCIVKLVFHEQFTASVGGIKFQCFRSPRKEARILDLVKDHPHFMHGVASHDDKRNVVRVIEYIAGKSLGNYIADIDLDHEAYFHETLGGILQHYLHCLEAVRFLHDHGEKHGDVRRDHILVETRTGQYRWIDFDYNYRHWENIYGYDLFGLGNILIYIVGKGDVLLGDLKRTGAGVFSRLVNEDLNIIFNNRVANLKKVYPYIPDRLNRVLLHFSNGTNWFYENATQLIDDLQEALGDIGRPAGEASAPVA